MNTLIVVYLGIVGLAFGSFALAMVDRMKSGKDWVRGRSECDKCKHRLAVIDLFPIFSWISTKGKCRYCKTKLSVAYPLTEILCGMAFAVSYWFLPYKLSGSNSALFVLWLLSLVIMTALVVFDVRWFTLPNKLVYPLVVLAFIHRLFFISNSENTLIHELIYTVLSVLVGFGFFLIIYLISSGKWIGDGDIRLGLAIGLFLSGPIETWLAIFFASLAGLVIGLFMARKKGKKIMTAKIPYGPMLILGLFVVYLFGSQLIDWYSHTFLYM